MDASGLIVNHSAVDVHRGRGDDRGGVDYIRPSIVNSAVGMLYAHGPSVTAWCEKEEPMQ